MSGIRSFARAVAMNARRRPGSSFSVNTASLSVAFAQICALADTRTRGPACEPLVSSLSDRMNQVLTKY